MYQSTKRYGHELGLSACFRQWRATHSHCSFLHGYALSFKFVFEAETLDDHNWVQDFGGLKELKQRLQQTFDHKLVVASDDPWRDELCALRGLSIADVLVMPAVGCEAFAEYAFNIAAGIVHRANEEYAAQRNSTRQAGEHRIWPDEVQRVRVVSCECAEHGANSATYVHE